MSVQRDLEPSAARRVTFLPLFVCLSALQRRLMLKLSDVMMVASCRVCVRSEEGEMEDAKERRIEAEREKGGFKQTNKKKRKLDQRSGKRLGSSL